MYSQFDWFFFPSSFSSFSSCACFLFSSSVKPQNKIKSKYGKIVRNVSQRKRENTKIIDLKTQSRATNNRNFIYHLHTFRFISIACISFSAFSIVWKQFFIPVKIQCDFFLKFFFFFCNSFPSYFCRIIMGLWRKQSLCSKA